MATYAWRYSKQDRTTSHLVYVAPETTGAEPAVAAVSRCGLVDAGSGRKWLGDAPMTRAHLASTRPCPRCEALVPETARAVA